MKKLNITDSSSDEPRKLLEFIQIMDLIAGSDHDTNFDPRDHLNETDLNYEFMMSFFDTKTGEFDYRKFMSSALQRLGTGYQSILLNYKDLVDNFCDAALQVLSGDQELVVMDEGDFVVKGKLIGTYETYAQWHKHAQYYIREYGTLNLVLCIDANGFYCNGYDLISSQENVFPLNAYLLDRVLEIPLHYKRIAYQ